MTHYRQGDVYLLAATVPPAAEARDVAGDLVLAEGEVTGHAHRIKAPGRRLTVWEADGQRYLEVREPVTLSHEEHGPIAVEPGTYEVRIQRVYQPGGEIRPVAD